ncbi:hypothetical protein CAP35_06950 [Chitinophagaceae bacterium IBVUCB1]|nr:hypothetical protein CAP35_06950 [Chitinophagaceae bacterium IBVUCB1]
MSVLHKFHIPVLGIGYSIDTPVKVARYSISSVVSIMDDELIEKMRKYYCDSINEVYIPIAPSEADCRAKRITAYLNLINRIINTQVAVLRMLPFEEESDIVKYFELLPDSSVIKAKYHQMIRLEQGDEKTTAENELRSIIEAGSIDVNIMAKVDKMNSDADGELLPAEYSDALSALRGYANSELNSSIVFSAGYNPRLYNYIETFKDFFPDGNGNLKKRIILKVSDYRSALVQGKLLAKKGIWVSEFRIESGLNCGGHAFATEGFLLGPILEEFKNKRSELASEIYALCVAAHKDKGILSFLERPDIKITVQGGIGTSDENDFLFEHYRVDGTGWGSPFLLVPEATNVDDQTLAQLAIARKEDYYLSQASPLGVPFNNFRNSSAETQRKERVDKKRPGSPCYKKYLVSNTEFTEAPICTASRQYQQLKIKQLKEKELPTELLESMLNDVIEKDCLCEGLTAPALLKDGLPLSHKLSAVTICPGPNLAYFSGVFSLSQMVSHIYGRINILNSLKRPNMFINELNLYIDYLKKEVQKIDLTPKQKKYYQSFKVNLINGVDYYKQLMPYLKHEAESHIASMKDDLRIALDSLNKLEISLA